MTREIWSPQGKPSSVFFVLDKLLEPIDHAQFAAVCKEWSYLAKVYNPLYEQPNHVKTPVEKILDSYKQHDCETALQITMRLHPNRKCADDGRGEDECTDYHHYRDILKSFCAIEV
ncbi:hypothetical protein ACE6H2_006954 [Prunus campanulata]